MDRISITVTGSLGADPQLDSNDRGTSRLFMRIAVNPRGQDGPTRWIAVSAYGYLADRTAASVRKGDLVTVRANDVQAWVYTDKRSGEPRGSLRLYAYDIAASMRFDSLITGQTSQRLAEPAAGAEASDAGGFSGPAGPDDPDGQGEPVDAAEAANRSVLSGVSA